MESSIKTSGHTHTVSNHYVKPTQNNNKWRWRWYGTILMGEKQTHRDWITNSAYPCMTLLT